MDRIFWVIVTASVLSKLALPLHAGDKSVLPDALVLEEAMQDAIRKAEPSIACILLSRSGDVRNPDLANPSHVPESYGSGVVIDEKGLILTNYHVVNEATRIFVRLPGGKSSYADIHAADPRSDLAVLRLLDEKVRPVNTITLGDGGNLRKGQFALSLANPFAAGFRDGSPSASWGIISNLRRRPPGSGKEEERGKTLHHCGTLIQTDARLNLGCSGGALIDLKGELIGLTTSTAAVTGGETPGGFAVPMDAGLRRIVEVLRRGEEVEYGFLGVGFDPLEVGQKRGVRLSNVILGSPAARAGLRAGEYVVAINGVPVHDHDDLFLLVGTLLAGATARLEVARAPGGPAEVHTVTLAKFYVPDSGKIIARNQPPAVGGLRVDYTSVLFQRVRGERIPNGVVIREVETNSPADRALLQVDKVITHVNGRPVNTPAEFYREMTNARGTVELTLAADEGRTAQTVKVDMK